jgi:hypothetical protein
MGDLGGNHWGTHATYRIDGSRVSIGPISMPCRRAIKAHECILVPVAACNADRAQYADIPVLHHCACPDSRTRTGTKPACQALPMHYFLGDGLGEAATGFLGWKISFLAAAHFCC